MWCMIAVAYKEVTHAYGQEALEIPQTQVLLLMAQAWWVRSSNCRALVEIAAGHDCCTRTHLWSPQEMAASCGINYGL